MTPAILDRPDRPDCPAFTSGATGTLGAAGATGTLGAAGATGTFGAAGATGTYGGAGLKKGKLFFVHTILFYWPATLTTAVALRSKEGVAAVQATRRREEGPRGRTGSGGGRSE